MQGLIPAQFVRSTEASGRVGVATSQRLEDHSETGCKNDQREQDDADALGPEQDLVVVV